jgi:transposase-like protein
MNCKYCQSKCIKKGFQKKEQRLFCKNCNKYQTLYYENRLIEKEDEVLIAKLVSDSMSIRGGCTSV